MEQFKGTPGPWVVDAGNVGAEFNIDSADGGTSIGITSQVFRDKDNEIRRANTQLIAAAPELLSVLQLIINYHDDGNCQLHREDVAMVRNAIKKALGES